MLAALPRLAKCANDGRGSTGFVPPEQFVIVLHVAPPSRLKNTPALAAPATIVLGSAGSNATSVGCGYGANAEKSIAPRRICDR